MKRILKKYLTLKVRIPAIFVFSLLLLATCIIGISFRRYEALNVEKHVKMAEGITTLMAERLNPERTDYYVQFNYHSEDYRNIVKYYYELKNSYPDVRYVYVYRLFMEEDDIKGEVIIDLDEDYESSVTDQSLNTVGSIYDADEEFTEDFGKMTKDNECVWHIVSTEEGRLISFVRPIMDKDGNYVCSACVDFSVDELYAKGYDFVIELLIVIVSIILGVIIIINIILSVILFNPLNRMTRCIQSFRYESEEDRFNNVNQIESLNIHVENEIDELYNALVMSVKDGAFNMSNLNRAKTEIQEISKTAYVDSLTGVRSKAAYNDALLQLRTDLKANPDLKFAFLMVDINNLKYVNDTYGHELGDAYIRGCCHIVCEIYKKSPVYRIGGDEFVVILKDADYEARDQLKEALGSEFERTHLDESVEEYCRYSASFGMADYVPAIDDSVEEVFKRADALMYEYKKEFKKKYGSYR